MKKIVSLNDIECPGELRFAIYDTSTGNFECVAGEQSWISAQDLDESCVWESVRYTGPTLEYFTSYRDDLVKLAKESGY